MFIRVKQHLLDRKTLFIAFVFLFVIIFIEPIKTFFDHVFVEPILQHVTSSIIKDIVIILICIGTTWKMVEEYREKNLMSDDWLLLSVFCAVIYLVCRFNDSYVYTSFYFIHFTKYADIILYPIVVLWVIKILEFRCVITEPVYQDSPFLMDIPISESDSDELNRNKFAKRIAAKIQSKSLTKNAGALAIGITGEWGSGKTSFSNMIENEVVKENRILIHFNPWMSSSSEQIIEDFFELLISKLKPYDHNLSKNIYSYAKTLTKLDENFVTKGAQMIGEIFDDSSKNEIYNSIDSSMSQIKKQIIIFIDDLDRLDKKEITSVLRLIRNTANFNNLVYIVAYDKDYVLEAVKIFNPSNYRAFLEKIFQFEFVLPYYKPEIIRKYLKDQLRSALPATKINEIELAIDSRAYKGLNICTALVQNHRTAIRLANAIIFEIEEIIEEVLFYDFYLLQVFKLKYPSVFKLFFDNSSIFLITESKQKVIYNRLRLAHEKILGHNAIQYAEIAKFIWQKENKTEKTDEERIPLFNLYLTENAEKFNLSESDKWNIEAILSELLNIDRKLEDDQVNYRYKAFVRNDNFHKYFAFQLEENDVSARDFEIARRKPFPEYLKRIEEWSSVGHYRAFLDRITKIEVFTDVIEFENQVKVLFEVGRKYANDNNIIGFDFEYLISILRYPEIELAKPEPQVYCSINSYQKFLRTLLANAPILTRGFENRLITLMLTQGENSYPFTPLEFAQISLNNFKEYVKRDCDLNFHFWDLFYYTSEWVPEDHKTKRNPIAEQIAKSYIRKKIAACGLGQFIVQTDIHSDSFFLDPDKRKFAFTSLNDFQEWLKHAKNIDRESDCYKEFVNFLDQNIPVLPNGIQFDFKHIKPVRWS